MARKVTTYPTLEKAKAAADEEYALRGWFVAVVPIATTGKYMLQANSSSDMVYSVGQEETNNN